MYTCTCIISFKLDIYLEYPEVSNIRELMIILKGSKSQNNDTTQYDELNIFFMFLLLVLRLVDQTRSHIYC